MVAYTWNSVLRGAQRNVKCAEKTTLHSAISPGIAVTERQKSPLHPNLRQNLTIYSTHSCPAIIIIRIIGMPTLLFCLVLKIFLFLLRYRCRKNQNKTQKDPSYAQT